jgi:membrane protease YdiL (CAAX protease family)
MKCVFVGSRGLRAGWRLLIFVSIVAAGVFVMVTAALGVAHFATHRSVHAVIAPALRGAPAQPVVLISSAILFAAALIASAIMARIEHRSLSVYGLPPALASGRNFVEGGITGFAALSLTLSGMFVCGVLRIDGLRDSGVGLLVDGLGWAATFLVVGLSEEYLFRGYALFTLTTGTGFGLATLLTSVAFALLHATNPGETPLGIVAVIVFALVLCFAIWRTGNLWFGVGFHAAWDWGETYVYGTPDSGLVTSHTLLATTASGPAWLSGSSAGPEGSVLALAALVAVGAYVGLRFPGRRYSQPVAAARPALV